MTENRSTILVIDDEEPIRDTCTQILTKEGFLTLTAENGVIGLRKIEEIKPDMALVDLKMPGISGIELLEKIREIDPEIVAIVITGYPTIESAVEAMKRGAYDFLPKPFTPDELRIIVRRGLEKRKLSLESASLRQEKERMKEYFITLVSHELRSPLVTIQQYCNTILGGFVGDVKPEQKEILKRCQERIKELLKLVEDWLNVSRIERGVIVENLKPLELSPLLTKIVNLLNPSAKTSKVTLNANIPSELPLVMGDNETLGLVFTNLISNAIKFNSEGGKVEIGLRDDGKNMTIEIADTGIGIPEESLQFVFDEFYRVRNKDTRNITGSGLGLSLAKKIVDAHSGTILAVSEPGKGSTFTVRLPKAL
ncbi:Sensor histidine kinase RcsC [subsurface metagenome]